MKNEQEHVSREVANTLGYMHRRGVPLESLLQNVEATVVRTMMRLAEADSDGARVGLIRREIDAVVARVLEMTPEQRDAILAASEARLAEAQMWAEEQLARALGGSTGKV